VAPTGNDLTGNDPPPVRIGISACLLGRPVRYDGGHKRDRYLVDVLGPHVDYVAVCPEVESGMSIPRPTLRLVRSGSGADPRMIVAETGDDLTTRMTRFSESRVRALDELQLSGYVLKKNSPSCGMERVKVYTEGVAGPPRKDGAGLFAAALCARFPNLPVEEEGRLEDAGLRECFIERVFAYHRLRALWRARWTLGALVAFHTAHKMALMAHTVVAYRQLGRLVARARELPRAELRDRYESEFMAALARPASRGRHANVLMHMAGHLKARLDHDDRHELVDLIESFRLGQTPLAAPLALLRHHARRLEVTYLADQTYLNPHPSELMLRHRV
jgi:uncharacterized protein YbgA (DUF1722 family)/uncharacterized protein YbbK (DUF523 family)